MNYISGLYNVQKCTVVILVCLAKVIDAVEDVFHGMFQQHLRLDVAGKILTIRIMSYIVVYFVFYIITEDLIITSVIALIVSFVQLLLLNYIALKEFEIEKKKWHYNQMKRLCRECFPLFIASYLVIYIGNAPKYAIDKVMSSEAQACFTYIFMPVFVISLLSQFVYQPVISKMALLWHEEKFTQFKNLIWKQVGLIALFSMAAVLGGYFLGIPVLSLLYGVNLKEYKTALVILLIGGGALAFVNFFQMIITIVRKQNLLIVGYMFAFLSFIFGGRAVVEHFGIVGISSFYTIVVSGIGIVFTVLTIRIIDKKGKENDNFR